MLGHSLFYPVVPSRNGVIRLWWKPFRWGCVVIHLPTLRQDGGFSAVLLFRLIETILDSSRCTRHRIIVWISAPGTSKSRVYRQNSDSRRDRSSIWDYTHSVHFSNQRDETVRWKTGPMGTYSSSRFGGSQRPTHSCAIVSFFFINKSRDYLRWLLLFSWLKTDRLETTAGPAMARLNDRDLEILKLDDRLLHSSLKEAPEESGRQQSSGFLYRFTNRFSNALGLVINGHHFLLTWKHSCILIFFFCPDERLELLWVP